MIVQIVRTVIEKLKYLLAQGLLIGGLAFGTSAWAADFKIRTDCEDGVYLLGDKVTWTIEAVNLRQGESVPASVSCKLVSNSFETLQEGCIELEGGRGSFSATRETPGTLMLVLEVPGSGLLASGAVFDPQSFKPTLPCPDDFNAFWEEKIKESKATPLNHLLIPEESTDPDVLLWQITLDNVRGAKIHGQLARPQKEDKFPAMLILQWAGFYALKKEWAVIPAADGWLVLNIQAHDIPAYESKEFYNNLGKARLKDFWKIGNEDRDTSYYLNMYLSTVQAVRYLKTRPDWDGKTLVVRGGSQGGMLALVAAALNADTVTGVMAKVPAGCDFNGELAGNKSARPDWWNSALERSDPEKVRRAAEYYDVVNLAPMIRSPTLIGIALGDLICPPPGMFIMCNQLAAPKELFIMPSAGHGTHPINPHKPYSDREAAWLDMLKKNISPVIKTCGQN